MSGLQSLLLHVVVVTPVCSFLISGGGGRLARPLNYMAAIAFLAAVAIGGEMATWQGQPPNLYRVLDVDRGASAAEMKKSYRDMSLKFHPDKNKSPEAPAQFQLINDAYEVLSDADSRRLYERFGPVAAGAKDIRTRAALASRTDMDTLLGMASFYVVWAVLTYLMTVGKASTDARTWSFIGLTVSLMIEFQMTFGGFDPLAAILTRTTTFEKISLLHALYPAFMHGARIMAQFTYVDLDAHLHAMLAAITEGQKEILISMEQCIQAVNASRKGGAPGGAAAHLANAAGAAESSALRGDEALPLAARMRRRQEAESKAAAAAAAAQAKKGGIPPWLWWVGLMIVMNYFK